MTAFFLIVVASEDTRAVTITVAVAATATDGAKVVLPSPFGVVAATEAMGGGTVVTRELIWSAMAGIACIALGATAGPATATATAVAFGCGFDSAGSWLYTRTVDPVERLDGNKFLSLVHFWSPGQIDTQSIVAKKN